MINGFHQFAPIFEGRAEVIVDVGGLGIERQSLMVAVNRLIEVSLFSESVSQVAMRGCVSGVQPQCAAERIDGLIAQTLIEKDGAKIVVRFRKIRIELKCAAITANGFA